MDGQPQTETRPRSTIARTAYTDDGIDNWEEEKIDQLSNLVRSITVTSQDINAELTCQDDLLTSIADREDQINDALKKQNRKVNRLIR